MTADKRRDTADTTRPIYIKGCRSELSVATLFSGRRKLRHGVEMVYSSVEGATSTAPHMLPIWQRQGNSYWGAEGSWFAGILLPLPWYSNSEIPHSHKTKNTFKPTVCQVLKKTPQMCGVKVSYSTDYIIKITELIRSVSLSEKLVLQLCVCHKLWDFSACGAEQKFPFPKQLPHKLSDVSLIKTEIVHLRTNPKPQIY